MAKEARLAVEPREESGSAAARRLRRKGWLPGIVCSHQGTATAVKLPSHAFELLLRRHASENLILDMQIGDESLKKVLLREVQHDPVSGELLHADFMEISMTEKLTVNIAVELKGDPVGVEQGGILEQMLWEIEVECLATDLVENIEVDVSALNIGDSIRVAELKLDPKLAVLTPRDVVVAAVLAPRAEEEEAPAEAAEEGAEPELVGKETEEEETEGEKKEERGKEKKEERGRES